MSDPVEFNDAELQDIIDACHDVIVPFDPPPLAEALETRIQEALEDLAAPSGDWSGVAVRHVPSSGGWSTTSSAFHVYPTYESEGIHYLAFLELNGQMLLPTIMEVSP